MAVTTINGRLTTPTGAGKVVTVQPFCAVRTLCDTATGILQPEPCASFKPMIPAMINPTETRRRALVESL